MFNLDNMPSVGYKIRLTEETRVEVHEFLFSKGVMWRSGSDKYISDRQFLYVDHVGNEKILSHSNNSKYFNECPEEEVFPLTLYTDIVNQEEIDSFKQEMLKYV